MGATAEVFWNDRWLRLGATTSFQRAGAGSRDIAFARIKGHSSRIARSLAFISAGNSGLLRAGDPLSTIFEHGAKPHTIEPRNALALRFPGGGFARGPVRHPGMAATPFLRPAAAALPILFQREMRRVL